MSREFLSLLLQHIDSLDANLRTSGATIQTDQGSITIPRVCQVRARKDRDGLIVDINPPPRASKKFLGIPFAADVGPIYIGPEGVTATVGGSRKVRLLATEFPPA